MSKKICSVSERAESGVAAVAQESPDCSGGMAVVDVQVAALSAPSWIWRLADRALSAVRLEHVKVVLFGQIVTFQSRLPVDSVTSLGIDDAPLLRRLSPAALRRAVVLFSAAVGSTHERLSAGADAIRVVGLRLGSQIPSVSDPAFFGFSGRTRLSAPTLVRHFGELVTAGA